MFLVHKKQEPIKWKYREPISELLRQRLAILPWDDIAIVCIGTDRSTGDALGPLTGTFLQERGVACMGTLQDPVHAVNLSNKISDIKTSHVLAIDSALGQFASQEYLMFSEGPLKPGTGVKKDLPGVGNWHIIGVVNISGFMENLVLSNTRLCLVYEMARTIADLVSDSVRRHSLDSAVSSHTDQYAIL